MVLSLSSGDNAGGGVEQGLDNARDTAQAT